MCGILPHRGKVTQCDPLRFGLCRPGTTEVVPGRVDRESARKNREPGPCSRERIDRRDPYGPVQPQFSEHASVGWNRVSFLIRL